MIIIETIIYREYSDNYIDNHLWRIINYRLYSWYNGKEGDISCKNESKIWNKVFTCEGSFSRKFILKMCSVDTCAVG